MTIPGGCNAAARLSNEQIRILEELWAVYAKGAIHPCGRFIIKPWGLGDHKPSVVPSVQSYIISTLQVATYHIPLIRKHNQQK